jgi:hypothetical protein
LRAFKPARGMPRKRPAFTLLAPCLGTKTIGNLFNLITEHHTRIGSIAQDLVGE